MSRTFPLSIVGALSFLVLTCVIGLAARDVQEDDAWQLARNARYEAHLIEDIVVILAYGQQPTAGYQVELRQRPEEPFPPMFELVQRPPDGISAQVVTPYATLAHFRHGTLARSVRIIDADGPHDVKIVKPQEE